MSKARRTLTDGLPGLRGDMFTDGRREMDRRLHGISKGAKVAIIPDNDVPGHKHHEQVARSVSPVATNVVVLELDGLPEKGDVSDWLNKGHTADELKALIRSAKTWEPSDGAENTEYGPRLTYQQAGAIVPSKPRWLWPLWMEAGTVHLLIGRQGGGKSTLAAWAVSNLTTGKPWPDDPKPCEPINCAVLSLEEPSERLVARLHAAAADVGRVLILGDIEDRHDDGRSYRRPWRLPKDCGPLELLLAAKGVGLVVIDGLGYSIAGD